MNRNSYANKKPAEILKDIFIEIVMLTKNQLKY